MQRGLWNPRKENPAMKLRGSRGCPTHCRGHLCAAIAAFTLVLGLPLTITRPAIAQQPSSETLVQDLRKGGYVIVVRHMNTDATQADTDTSHLENCTASSPKPAAPTPQLSALRCAASKSRWGRSAPSRMRRSRRTPR